MGNEYASKQKCTDDLSNRNLNHPKIFLKEEKNVTPFWTVWAALIWFYLYQRLNECEILGVDFLCSHKAGDGSSGSLAAQSFFAALATFQPFREDFFIGRPTLYGFIWPPHGLNDLVQTQV